MDGGGIDNPAFMEKSAAWEEETSNNNPVLETVKEMPPSPPKLAPDPLPPVVNDDPDMAPVLKVAPASLQPPPQNSPSSKHNEDQSFSQEQLELLLSPKNLSNK